MKNYTVKIRSLQERENIILAFLKMGYWFAEDCYCLNHYNAPIEEYPYVYTENDRIYYGDNSGGDNITAPSKILKVLKNI